ncbi:TrbC/VirB2 family protein [Sphingomonas sp. 7/4-4]|uniref:TrbC/VirB2 family protein n=1 Tax=Sphingomonas sp. 7/4-4 TaxID=3018446 RepID=UPI00300DDCDD
MLNYAFSAALSRLPVTSWAYTASLDDPAGSSVILRAVQWLEGTLLGTVATTVAVISVASVGFMALSGRVDLRRAVTVIVGCFVLFGAPGIVAGLRDLAGGGSASVLASSPPLPADLSRLNTRPQRPADYDPYAGAAVPK